VKLETLVKQFKWCQQLQEIMRDKPNAGPPIAPVNRPGRFPRRAAHWKSRKSKGKDHTRAESIPEKDDFDPDDEELKGSEVGD
jgi:hypothetical protein